MLEPETLTGAVLFDADGVIQHAADDWQGRLRSVLGDGADVRAFLGEVFQAERPALRGERDFESILSEALARWRRPGRLRDALRVWQAITVNAGVMQIVAELRAAGVYCALASNQNACRARYMSDDLGYAASFDHAFYSCDLGFTKPDLRFFQAVIDALRLPPDQVLFIDDRQENVAAARDAGIRAALFQPPPGTESAQELRRLLEAAGYGHIAGAGSR